MESLTIRVRGLFKFRPKISIIIPFYNSEKYILKCLESIVLWTRTPYEIICVNDGSTDNSLAIVKRFCLTHPQVRLVSFQENIGLYHARLQGILKARGEYVGFLDSDDYVDEGYFDLLYNCAIQNESDVAVGQIVNVNSDGVAYIQSRCAKFPYVEADNDETELYTMYWRQQGLCYHWHVVWNKIYKREVIIRCIDTLEKQTKHLVMMEDFIFTSVFFSNIKSYSVDTKARYFYIDHKESVTKSMEKTAMQKNFEDMGTAFNFVDDFLGSDLQRSKYRDDLMEWRRLYYRIWKSKIKDLEIGDCECEQFLNMLQCDETREYQTKDNYYYELAEFV